MKKIIGKNLKAFRKLNNFTQEKVSQYLGINRSTYGNYESGERETPLDVLEKCADVYGCDLLLFFEDNEVAADDMLVCAFRVNDISDEDLKEVAHFKNIVKNYIKLNELLKK